MHKSYQKSVVKLALLITILLGYFLYLSWKYDVATGGFVSLLTWSFFVLCTPIADAGFLLDFPLRLLFNIRMVISEIIVWLIAITINVITLLYSPEIYQKTFLTSIFYKILITPYPYWSVIILSGIGTFISVIFGDELIDTVHSKNQGIRHKHKYRFLLLYILFFLLIFWIYYHLLDALGITVLE